MNKLDCCKNEPSVGPKLTKSDALQDNVNRALRNLEAVIVQLELSVGVGATPQDEKCSAPEAPPYTLVGVLDTYGHEVANRLNSFEERVSFLIESIRG